MNCESLIKVIDAYIAKADNDLMDALDDVGFIDAAETVEDISQLEERVAQTLKRETKQIIDAAEASEDLETFANEIWSDVKLSDKTGEALSRVFFEKFTEAMPDLINHYTHKIDPDMVVEQITKRTTAWVQDWSRELGAIMRLDTHEGVEKILTESLKQGHSVADFTQAIRDSGIRDEYFRARRAAVTEMLTAHSVAQQESFIQSAVVEKKGWRHTGSYRNQPRENHVAMDKQTVPVGEPFELEAKDGRVHDPMYPRDTKLPPGERINCHCIAQPIVSEDILGLSIEERRALQEQAIAEDDGEWEKELDAKNRAKAGIDETVYETDETRYNERQEKIHADILENYNLSVNTSKQDRHIEGAAGFKEGRSVLTANPKRLIKKYAGHSQAIVVKGEFKNKERFSHTSDIGTWVSRDGKSSLPTTYGIIHYSKDGGAHIIPAKPPDFETSRNEVNDI